MGELGLPCADRATPAVLPRVVATRTLSQAVGPVPRAPVRAPPVTIEAHSDSSAVECVTLIDKLILFRSQVSDMPPPSLYPPPTPPLPSPPLPPNFLSASAYTQHCFA
jgi:hypothetical protein